MGETACEVISDLNSCLLLNEALLSMASRTGASEIQKGNFPKQTSVCFKLYIILSSIIKSCRAPPCLRSKPSLSQYPCSSVEPTQLSDLLRHLCSVTLLHKNEAVKISHRVLFYIRWQNLSSWGGGVAEVNDIYCTNTICEVLQKEKFVLTLLLHLKREGTVTVHGQYLAKRKGHFIVYDSKCLLKTGHFQDMWQFSPIKVRNLDQQMRQTCGSRQNLLCDITYKMQFFIHNQFSYWSLK